MLLCQRGQKPFHIPTVAQEVFDVSGAGDTVIATFTLAIRGRRIAGGSRHLLEPRRRCGSRESRHGHRKSRRIAGELPAESMKRAGFHGTDAFHKRW
jgi:sugar/nucleoside kinase (ribokinase family)